MVVVVAAIAAAIVTDLRGICLLFFSGTPASKSAHIFHCFHSCAGNDRRAGARNILTVQKTGVRLTAARRDTHYFQAPQLALGRKKATRLYLLQTYDNSLRLRVQFEHFVAHLSAPTGLLVTAERQ